MSGTQAAQLAARVLEQIKDHPETHNQSVIIRRTTDPVAPCGMQACVAGWAYLLGAQHPDPCWRGYSNNDESWEVADYAFAPGDARNDPSVDIWDAAADMLGLDKDEAYRLFHTKRTRAEVLAPLERMAQGQRPFAAPEEEG